MVYELISKVYLLNDIELNNVRGKIIKLIDNTLAQDEYYLSFHRKNSFKNYTVDGLHRVERDGIYHKGKIYAFRIRTVDSQLSDYLKKSLFTSYTNDMKVLTVTKRTIPKKHIEKVFSITPIVIKTPEAGYWRSHISIDEYEIKIKNNIIKNYNTFYNTKINEDFQLFTQFEFNNKKPIAVPFKNITLLGDKLTFHVSENEMAQELAYFTIGVGIGECGGRGCGFVGYRYL